MTFQCLKGSYRQEGNGLLTWSVSERTKGNGFKLRGGRFRLVLGRNSSFRGLRHWHKPPGEVVSLLSFGGT